VIGLTGSAFADNYSLSTPYCLAKGSTKGRQKTLFILAAIGRIGPLVFGVAFILIGRFYYARHSTTLMRANTHAPGGVMTMRAPVLQGNMNSVSPHNCVSESTDSLRERTVHRLNKMYEWLMASFFVSYAPMYFATIYYAVVPYPQAEISLYLHLSWLFSNLDNFFSIFIYYWYVFRMFRSGKRAIMPSSNGLEGSSLVQGGGHHLMTPGGDQRNHRAMILSPVLPMPLINSDYDET
jgi:hypothetical protein